MHKNDIDEKVVIESIKSQISKDPIILYMKGTPEFPQCGFSANAVAVIQSYGKPFSFINILNNPNIRSILPKYSNWPTFPQLYINGELIGGCDIILELHESGELKEIINAAA